MDANAIAMTRRRLKFLFHVRLSDSVFRWTSTVAAHHPSLKIYYGPRRGSKSQIAMKTSRPLRSKLGPLDMHNWEFLHRRELSLPNIILLQLVSKGMRNSFADGSDSSFIAAIPDRRRLNRSLTSDVTIQVR